MLHRHPHHGAGPGTTEGLIDALSKAMKPVRPSSADALRDALLGGSLVATALFFAGIGVRADIGAALLTTSFWLKLCYTIAVAGLAWRAVRARGTPGAVWRAPWRLTLPPLAVAALVVVEIARAGAVPDAAYWMSVSWRSCPVHVFALACPIGAGVLWTLRTMAPVRIRSAGFAAGLVSGAIAAGIYSFGCGETSTGFVLVWYSLAMFIPGIAGALVAPAVLRW